MLQKEHENKIIIFHNTFLIIVALLSRL